jgi:hypothetical protein
MSRHATTGRPVVDQFPVWEDDGYTKKSGETVFTVTIWKDGVVQSIPSSITEIGTSGEYEITFTPDDSGFWLAEVKIPYNEQVWFGQYDTEKSDLEFTASMAEDGATARFTVWGEDHQGRATFLTGMTAEIRDSAGGLVAPLGAGVGPSGENTFLFTITASVLLYNVPYFLSVVATNGTITWDGNCGFVRVD